MMRRFAPALLIVVAACAVGPDYQRPELDAPRHWRATEANSQPLHADEWWRLFNDPLLDRLIDAALAENRDLKIAAARVLEARANVVVTRSLQFPELSAQAAATRTRAANGGSTSPGVSFIGENYRLQGDVSFELDLWGKLRRATEAARADLLATRYAREVTRLALISAVGSGYFNLRSLDLQLVIAERTLGSREEALSLTQKRFNGGVVSELDVRQAEAESQVARAIIPDLQRQIVFQQDALSVLLGRYPNEIERGKTITAISVPPDVPLGLPSELLARRPDILSTEQNLIAANAQIGVAKAAYFPSISLTGLLGVESAELSNLLRSGSRIWQAGIGAGLPIFNAGRVSAQVDAAVARREQALQQYRKIVETAFAEVEDALVAHRTAREKYNAQDAQVKALRRSLRLADLRYRNGQSAYIEVLDAERNLFNAELGQVQTRQSQLDALVQLYKALGGGWEL